MFKDYQPDLVMNDPVVKDMAKKYNKNVGQVCRFHGLANICNGICSKAPYGTECISVASKHVHRQAEDIRNHKAHDWLVCAPCTSCLELCSRATLSIFVQ